MQFLKKDFLKTNRTSAFILFLGAVLLIISRLLNTDYVMPSGLRLLRYSSLLLISFSLLLLFIKNKKVILGNVMLFLLLLIAIEVTCFFMLGMPTATNKDFGLPYMSEEHISTHLGTVPYADSVYHNVLIKNNDTVYNVKSSIDKNSLRITPNHNPEHNQFALFFGCSIAYGEGLNDNETLPYQFQENSSNYNSYNFAYPGYGTNHMLARMEYQNLSDNVTEKNGVAFYIFFWDHIYRAIGAMQHYCGWASNAPYYTLEDNQLIRKKKFKNGRYAISKTYELIHQSNIVKKFKLDFPIELNAEHYNLISEIILQSKETYKQQFGNDKFYVVFYPSYTNYTKEQLNQFQSYLKTKNIDYLDLNDLMTYGPEHTLGGDPHPNANTNKVISKELLNRIDKKN